MKQKKVKLSAFLMLALGLTGLKAQEANTSSGGNALGSGGSASYSVGQLVYTTNSGSGGSLSQGVQQPFEITVITAINESKGIELQFKAYPNPTIDKLILKTEGSDQTTLTATLFDINGKILLNQKVTVSETTISMENFAPATYFLKITNNNKEVKTFKIIKN